MNHEPEKICITCKKKKVEMIRIIKVDGKEAEGTHLWFCNNTTCPFGVNVDNIKNWKRA